jgi:hypothetical protein
VSECLLYAGRLSDRGYAQVWIDGRTVRLHRKMYEQFNGPIPEDAEIHHTCGVKHCLNPEHLQALGRDDHRRLHDPLGTAARRAQTHCHAGHERTPDNIYVTPAGQWACKACRRENSRRYREAQRCPS